MNLTAWSRMIPALCAWMLLGAGVSGAQEAGTAGSGELREDYWSQEVVDLFATLPVQDGGRVKPLSSFAGMRLLTLNGKRTLKLEDGSRLDPNRWMLDVLFFPELAEDYPCFRIQDSAVLTAMGLDSKKRRDWYTYRELTPGREALRTEASRAVEVENAKRTSLDNQVLKLSQDLAAYEMMASLLYISRQDYPTDADPALASVFGPKQPGIAWMLPGIPEMLALTSEEASDSPTYLASIGLVQSLQTASRVGGYAPTLFPPATIDDGHDHDDTTWWSPYDLLYAAFQGEGRWIETQVGLLAMLEQLESQKHDQAAFTATLREFHHRSVELAEARGEYKYIPLEVDLYRWDPFYRSLYAFLAAFLLSVVGLLLPKVRALPYATAGAVVLGLGLAVFGIVLRCIIRERPPVVTLYDTILFITAVAVLAALFMEWLTRQRIAMFLAAFLGAAGMFLASRYELKEVATAGDTMASVMAVLDTNYYLAIHVTTITMGYAGGLLAAAIAHVWILCRLFGVRKGDKEFYRGISRMIYGSICFCLLFSLFGTIMGGVWANDSWGRFWGWDPKENGALLICIWMLVILHGRLGGYLRERGIANMAILGGGVVAFSWWGVNLLGVGMHSYGFTSGVVNILYTVAGIEAALLLASVVHGFKDGSGGGGGKPPVQPPAQPPTEATA